MESNLSPALHHIDFAADQEDHFPTEEGKHALT